MDKKTKVLIGLAVIYWLFPDLMTGTPIDDIVVAIVCGIVNKKFPDKEQKLVEETFKVN